MFVYERPVRFEDVDAAQIVFFARYLHYCHEAMEALMGAADGGYPGMIMGRKIGLPAVRVECEYRAPLRFGDVARLHVTVPQLGNRSATLRYAIQRADSGDEVAVILHKVVISDLTQLRSIEMPPDIRAALAAHVTPPA